MKRLKEEHINLLKNKWITRADFTVDEFSFKGWEGEWQVLKNGKTIDVFSFHRMDQVEFENTLNDIFNDERKEDIWLDIW